MFNKSIFQGRLDFDNERSFGKAHKMFLHKLENQYKPIDIIFDEEELFDQENLRIAIPRTVKNILEKSFKSTVTLLEYMSQFSISGTIGAWMMDEGKLKHFAWIEPESDKTIVQNYLISKKYVSDMEMQSALAKLDEVINQYDKHSQAYERRGYVNYKLGKWHDAKRDFKKALGINNDNSLAHLGLGKVQMREENYAEAAESFKMVTKTAIALQDIHWSARRLKALCHIEQKEWKDAEFELRFFTKRQFKADSVNLKHVKSAFYNYGNVLAELDQFQEALDAYEKALTLDSGNQKHVDDGEILISRGSTRHKMGKTGYIADWKKASEMGFEKANLLLGQLS